MSLIARRLEKNGESSGNAIYRAIFEKGCISKPVCLMTDWEVDVLVASIMDERGVKSLSREELQAP